MLAAKKYLTSLFNLLTREMNFFICFIHSINPSNNLRFSGLEKNSKFSVFLISKSRTAAIAPLHLFKRQLHNSLLCFAESYNFIISSPSLKKEPTRGAKSL